MKAFTLLCGLMFIGCGSGPELFPTSSTTGQTTTASGGGQGGDGGAPTTTTDSTTAMAGGGGIGGTATTSTTTTATTTTTVTTGSGGSGSAGGGVPVGCDPPSFSGYDCTGDDACEAIENYGSGAAQCGAQCSGAFLVSADVSVPDEISWVFAPKEFPACPNECFWSYVLKIPGPGCVRATVSEGLFLGTSHVDQQCVTADGTQCVSEKAKSVNPSDDLRVIVNAEPGTKAGWLRLERAPIVDGSCSAWLCP